MILILCRFKKFPKRWGDTVIIFYVATYVACAALPFALLHKEVNFTVNFTSWIWNLLRFLGCLFFGCFVFWPKKLYLFGMHWNIFFVIIQGFPPGYFDDPSILILAQIFGKRRVFFEFRKYHYFTFWIWNLTEFRLLFVVQPIVFLEALLYFL